jgi:putative ABC transport system permease protein
MMARGGNRSGAVVRGLSVLRRVTGMGIGGSLALAVLTGGCVLAATAGPREAQATGLLGVRQMMNGLPPVEKTIVVTTNYESVSGALQEVTTQVSLTRGNLDDITTQLHRDFAAGPLPLAPRSADWATMTSTPRGVISALPALHGIPAQVEVAYPYPAAGHLRLVAGTMPGTSPKKPKNRIQVVVTAQTASAWGLRPGSQVAIIAPLETLISGSRPRSSTFKLNLDVTGIVEPTDPGSSFWKADPLLAAPNLYVSQSKLWEGAFIADPGEIARMQEIFGLAGLNIRWEFPVTTTGLRAQAPALYSEVKQFTVETPALTGLLIGPMSSALSTSSALLEPLATLVAAANGVNVLLWMIYVGLALAGVVMMLLAARMLAARRSAEMALRRARGASAAHLFWRGSLGAAVAAVPAAAMAWALAVRLVPGAGPAGWVAWWPGIATLAVATLGPGLAAVWRHRLPRRRRAGVRERAQWRRRWATRVVFEVTAVAAATGGIIVVRQQGGAGDLYTSAAPLLVAVPAVIVVLRLYQVLLRGLARASARQRGVIGFLGLTRAAQATATLALPAVTLVLALTMAAFTIMVRDAVLRGEVAASWQQTGADVAIAFAPGSGAGPSAVRAFAAVPGVQHAATALEIPVSLADGELVTAIAVDPAGYAALVASTQGYSAVDPALLTLAPGQAAVPVLASAAAAGVLARQGSVPIAAQHGLPALRVRVAGELQSTPALPGGGTFMVLPLSGVGAPPANLVLLTGAAIDVGRLHAVLGAMPGADILTMTTRSQVLQELTGAPLQHGTFLIFTLAIVCALMLALAVMLLELALSTADREQTMAKLATMGLDERQRVRLSVFETLPAIAASAVAAAACAVALPRLVAPAINLSAFTQSQAVVPLRPDFASFLLPLAGLLVVTLVALAYEIRSWRGRVAATLRA